MSKKTANVVNFNIVFGNDEQPMLDFFDSIIYPALNSGIVKVVDDNEYMFKNIEVLQNDNNIYVLKGNIVKRTVLEIKSDLDENGELVEKDERYSSAPYSSFVINLVNHRMIYIPNQKGSPAINTFRSTLKHVIDAYTKEINTKLEEGYKLPYAIVNIVGIPSAKHMDELLENVKKINSLTLRFYPLNGDIDYTGAFGILTKEIRSEVDCKNGEVVFKSPKSINGVKNVIEKAAGTINPIIKVLTNEGCKATFKDYELSEKYEMEISDNLDINSEVQSIMHSMNNINTLSYSNDAHEEIYNRNFDKILKFVKK